MPKFEIIEKQPVKHLRTEGQINFPIKLEDSPIHGKGAFSLVTIPARKKIGSMGGTVISGKAADRQLKRTNLLKLVELDNGTVLDGSINGNDLAHVNHSCRPNSFTRVIGKDVEFYALRTIHPGEEITCSYGESYHEGTRPCTCGSKDCEGYL